MDDESHQGCLEGLVAAMGYFNIRVYSQKLHKMGRQEGVRYGGRLKRLTLHKPGSQKKTILHANTTKLINKTLNQTSHAIKHPAKEGTVLARIEPHYLTGLYESLNCKANSYQALVSGNNLDISAPKPALGHGLADLNHYSVLANYKEPVLNSQR
ncbi:hypothetical protein AVEN_58734-1 [Araneus ventricosus]|uniref:Uncharacterized protein n=1 Tax=Araneus ventricosus TaxID=182803 RepID=A0A4Y2VCV5_ARAVE|nr:hypothetical protein AVEN_58734-1 [Araneus ventricosus]